ncbi:Hypothetical protein, conserved [Brucella abortus str. 2308 A]|uniref:Uncharacterized protein n=6 Tax=Brucella TaxID=234 RepID=Q2YIY0_BRUA2|nr:hypothetical protein BRA0856 [Brucella suis 1330]AAX75806.1 hypothetical protein BruAb2_0375 [Brucella abortus bv. 1 str. 9-941]ABX64025.1 Hypothetical protein, conserved [Brucella canis ATCC 23365]ACU49966.1 hypothetical protein BMI_II850 [Brucella microti CCM 4915]AEK56329.1 hypothetical protein BPI_II912 [Brucella pinnipedialis B2/94]AEU07977.1 hypothetical protein BSVBI22_B0848 [Brucella suis VBI22]AHN48573.1 hypothetical protein BSS2_II0811 [Brucella suis bv. 1 str. S2]EEH12864.1 Hyp
MKKEYFDMIESLFYIHFPWSDSNICIPRFKR